MGTVADKLTYLNNTKQGLKNVINYTGAGIDNNTTFRDYEEKLYNGYLDILKDDGETLFNNLPKVTGEGTSVTLDNTANSKMKIELEPSELSQDGTPTPETPQEIHTISGDNEIKVENINLWDEIIEAGRLNTTTGEKIDDNNYKRSKNYIPVSENIIYYVNLGNNATAWIGVGYYDKNKNFISWKGAVVNKKIFIPDSGVAYIRFYISNTDYEKICINVSNENINGTYYSHQEQTLPLNLGDLEYCKIGDYEDEFVYNETDTTLELNKWYLKKNIGKVVLDGSEDWVNLNYAYYSSKLNGIIKNILSSDTTRYLLSDYFNGISAYEGGRQGEKGTYTINEQIYLRGFYDRFADVTTLKTWLSTHNTDIYFPLETPTYTLLNDTLQTQLNNIRDKVLAYQDQTNISQVNNDLPFRLKLSAIKKYTE